jgi:Tol biopolymer transport system component
MTFKKQNQGENTMKKSIKKQTLTMICATAVVAATSMGILPLAMAAPKKVAKKAVKKAPVAARLKVANKFQTPQKGVNIVNLWNGSMKLVRKGYVNWELSPDRKMLVYVDNQEIKGTTNVNCVVYLSSPPGSPAKKIGAYPFDAEVPFPAPSWSSDSKRISITGMAPKSLNDMEIVISTTGRILSRKRITDNSAYSTNRTGYSPNRQYRAAIIPNNERVVVIKQAKSGREVRRVNVSENVSGLSWSSDSKKVLLSSESRIYSYDVPAGKLRTLISRFGTTYGASYSPNNQWIVFYASNGRPGYPNYQERGYLGGLYVAKADGSAITQITKNVYYEISDADDREFQWIDNSHIAFRRTFYEDEGS